MSKESSFLSAAAVAAITAGCATTECLDNQNSRPNAVFIGSGGPSADKQISIDSLTVFGIGAPENALLSQNAPLSGLTLPFRIGEDQTRYVFRYGGSLKGLNDTLTFTYRSVPEFVSAACGALYVFDDVKAETTKWVIDSVVCPWSRIDNIERDYIKIYFRTAEGPEDKAE